MSKRTLNAEMNKRGEPKGHEEVFSAALGRQDPAAIKKETVGEVGRLKG